MFREPRLDSSGFMERDPGDLMIPHPTHFNLPNRVGEREEGC